MFNFNHQTRIISGAGSLGEVGTQAKSLGATKALIVSDPFFKDSKTIDFIIDCLKKEEISSFTYTKVQPNPRDYDCEEGAEIAKEQGIDIIIGLGGGSALDEAKAIAALVSNGGKCSDWDFTDLDKPMLANICIPTTAGTGAEVTFCAVLDDTDRHFKMAMFDSINLIPTIAILDPELTITLPQSATAGPGMDVMTHAIEAYTVKVHNPISDSLALSAIKLVKKYLPIAFTNPTNIEAREKMLIASSMAGMAFINSNVGAVHAMSETIGAKYDLPHGLLNALLLTPVIEYSLDAEIERYADIAVALGVDPDGKNSSQVAEEGLKVLREFTKQFNFPNLEKLDKFGQDDFDSLAEKALINDLTADNAKELTKKGYIEILEKAYKF
ncbi:hypothetical protein BG261_01855 [Floricoccus tropicus]|uniref:Uncharacterized protein n=1 Tax=Floricoccus tropicus TaxID=1859473 RepID=A0A1E8GM74_9LACT|nr:iron-containing alcohol dehydrogenase [Floricoccus tropicus]OFI49351.1 hypothetical protein BG261_01855 [Floricoccus tropicus]